MEVIKKRWIEIPGISPSHFERMKNDLTRIQGIHELKLDEKRRRIRIIYDLEKITFKEILSRIERSGMNLKNGFWHRLRHGILNYSEQNERENRHTPPSPCCSNPEKILNKAHE